MLISKSGLVVLSLFITLLLASVIGKTAPEFKVTVDTENFKEIRVPLHLWRKIVSRNYNPNDKTSHANDYLKSKQNDINGTMVHEVVLNIVVPQDQNEDIVDPIQEEILIEPQVPIDSVTSVPEDSQAVADPQVVSEAPSPVVADETVASVDDPSSVLVQSTRYPCVCNEGVCECCASFFQQKGCANLRFLPEEFSFEMKMTMNGNVVAKRKLPVSDPPPFCFNPRRAPFLELCAQLTDISIKKQNVHACVDFDASIGGFDLFSWNYDCLKFGRQGIVGGQKRPASGGESGIFDFLSFGGGGDDDDGGIFDGILGDDDEDDDDEGDY